ncbi:hypothetical protein BT96DRAFT_926698 [Gymnopus androsaceus JB14]|uniref:Uncharacterized protein n=1 Tax=Gymnopus androsaceus JB14 TaxID=1447944 RepID=A0A6A4GUQ3_9AGAR|nr:hypothetical protein BT96DRAFT_926698 [Gymnopus androsaceus JB14]
MILASGKSRVDKGQDNQKWRAEHIADDGWALRSLYQHDGQVLYLNYSGKERSLVGGSDLRRWNITQWNTRGGAEFRLWVPDAPSPGQVAEVAGGNDGDAQFWLFQEVPN